MNKLTISSLITTFAASSMFADVSTVPNTAGYYEISDSIPASVSLDSSKEYLLTNVVYVESGATLTIPAGTVVRGVIGALNTDETAVEIEPGTLVITKGAQINAVGTPAAPIIFTYEGDSNPKTNPTAPLISDTLVTGLWGGIIILGNAPTNVDLSSDNDLLVAGTDFIEGLVEPTGTDPQTADMRGVYGGDAPHDSSGIMKYVSIRNGGFNLSADNEINGLTMGGVGAGTVLEYIEVIAGQDDGFEWFGGTVNSKYLLSAYNNDDAFDYDQGFSGLGQFWAVVQADNGADGDKGGEFDGDDQALAKPYAVPVIYNMTVIGTGAEAKTYVKDTTGDNPNTTEVETNYVLSSKAAYKNGGGQIDYDANAGGSLFNSIIVDTAVSALDLNGTCGDMADAKLLQVRNNIFFQDLTQPFASADTSTTTRSVSISADRTESGSTVTYTASVNVGYDAGYADKVLGDNAFTNPMFGGANFAHMETASRYSVGGVYLKPSSTPDVTGSLEPYIGSFFTAVNYKGAFSPSETAWTSGWTVPSKLGYFVE